MPRRAYFTEDEKENMRLRSAAGEGLISIAQDYDCSVSTIFLNLHPEKRQVYIKRKLAGRQRAGERHEAQARICAIIREATHVR